MKRNKEKLESRVKKCYEKAPFPNNLQKAKNFDEELQRNTRWIKLNLDSLGEGITKLSPYKILCAGCGTGEEAISLAQIFPNSQIHAIDISADSLRIAKQNLKKARVSNVKLEKLSIMEGLPQSRNSYDFIYCAGVIHHLSDPQLGFNILTQKLNSKGKIVIMLYNTYGLFLYNVQLFALKLLAGPDESKRLSLVKLFGLTKNKSKAYIYDTYINPQVKTFTIEQVAKWGVVNSVKLKSIVPPLYLSGLINFALEGQEFLFRRKGFTGTVIKIAKILFKQSKVKIYKGKLPLYRTQFFQFIYLILGKGECQYYFEK